MAKSLVGPDGRAEVDQKVAGVLERMLREMSMGRLWVSLKVSGELRHTSWTQAGWLLPMAVVLITYQRAD